MARFNFVGDVEFFFKLSCQVAENFNLIVPYSRAFERRQSNCLVSSLFGQLDRDCGTQFIINQYQKCKDHECTNTIIIQGCSNDPLNILKVSQGLLDIHQKAISGSIFDRFISFEIEPKNKNNIFTDTKPDDFIDDVFKIGEEEFEETLCSFSKKVEYLTKNMETFNLMDHFLKCVDNKDDEEMDNLDIPDEKSSISGGSRVSSHKSKNDGAFLMDNFEKIVENGDKMFSIGAIAWNDFEQELKYFEKSTDILLKNMKTDKVLLVTDFY